MARSGVSLLLSRSHAEPAKRCEYGKRYGQGKKDFERPEIMRGIVVRPCKAEPQYKAQRHSGNKAEEFGSPTSADVTGKCTENSSPNHIHCRARLGYEDYNPPANAQD